VAGDVPAAALAFTRGELPDQDGLRVKLSHFRGQRVVVYFYPKAETSGCTTQACGARDRRAEYAAAGATALGVSPDPASKVKSFHDKHQLGFALLADEDHGVAEAPGGGVRSRCTGAPFRQRAHDLHHRPDGRVTEVLRKVKPAEHDRLVLEALAKARPRVV
jgi:peroxiredoxin Q/BCP